PPMSQIIEHPERLAHDLVRALAFDIDDKAGAACVVLVAWVVESLRFRQSAIPLHGHALFDSVFKFLTSPCRVRRAFPGSGCVSCSTEICARSVCVEST